MVRSLVLLRLLAQHVREPAMADQLFLALLPLVRYRRGMNEGEALSSPSSVEEE